MSAASDEEAPIWFIVPVMAFAASVTSMRAASDSTLAASVTSIRASGAFSSSGACEPMSFMASTISPAEDWKRPLMSRAPSPNFFMPSASRPVSACRSARWSSKSAAAFAASTNTFARPPTAMAAAPAGDTRPLNTPPKLPRPADPAMPAIELMSPFRADRLLSNPEEAPPSISGALIALVAASTRASSSR